MLSECQEITWSGMSSRGERTYFRDQLAGALGALLFGMVFLRPLERTEDKSHRVVVRDRMLVSPPMYMLEP